MPDLACGCRVDKRRRLIRACRAHRDIFQAAGFAAHWTIGGDELRAVMTDHATQPILIHQARGTSPTGAIQDQLDSRQSARALENRPYPKDDALHADIRDGHVVSRGVAPTYRAAIGPTPQVPAGWSVEQKQEIATQFVRRIERARDTHGDRLSPRENRALWRLERVWRDRALGHDRRYLARGNTVRHDLGTPPAV